jgi:hypothetical protein
MRKRAEGLDPEARKRHGVEKSTVLKTAPFKRHL